MWMDGICLRSMLPFSLFLYTISETESESSSLVAKSWLTIFNLSVCLCLHFFLLLGYWWTDHWTNTFQKINLQQDVWWYFQRHRLLYFIVKEDRKNIHIYIYIYIYIYIWIYIHIYKYIYTYMNIHTHIYNIYGHFWNMSLYN